MREDNYKNVLRQGFEITAESLDKLPTDGDSPVNMRSGQQVSIELLRNWLNECEYKHGEICHVSGRSSRYKSDVDVILIDVIEQRLVHASSGRGTLPSAMSGEEQVFPRHYRQTTQNVSSQGLWVALPLQNCPLPFKML